MTAQELIDLLQLEPHLQLAAETRELVSLPNQCRLLVHRFQVLPLGCSA